MNLSNNQVFNELYERGAEVLSVYVYEYSDSSYMVSVNFIEAEDNDRLYVCVYDDQQEALERADVLACELCCEMKNLID